MTIVTIYLLLAYWFYKASKVQTSLRGSDSWCDYAPPEILGSLWPVTTLIMLLAYDWVKLLRLLSFKKF